MVARNTDTDKTELQPNPSQVVNRKYLKQALLVGIVGMLICSSMYAIHQGGILSFLLLTILVFGIPAVVMQRTVKLSAGWSSSDVTLRVLKATALAIGLTFLPMLVSAGYLWFLRLQQPGSIIIHTAYTNYYRDAPETALQVFLALVVISLGLGAFLSGIAGHIVRRSSSDNMSNQTV